MVPTNLQQKKRICFLYQQQLRALATYKSERINQRKTLQDIDRAMIVILVQAVPKRLLQTPEDGQEEDMDGRRQQRQPRPQATTNTEFPSPRRDIVTRYISTKRGRMIVTTSSAELIIITVLSSSFSLSNNNSN